MSKHEPKGSQFNRMTFIRNVTFNKPAQANSMTRLYTDQLKTDRMNFHIYHV